MPTGDKTVVMHIDEQLPMLTRAMIAAADAAAAIIEAHQRIPVEVKVKGAGKASRASTVVTEVDLMSQKAILDVLRPIATEYKFAILAEEGVDNKERLEKEFFWCVDPLDGTLPFIERQHGYSVSIALISRCGEPVIGVVHDVWGKVVYHAIKGYGAFRNQQPWKLPPSCLSKDTRLRVLFDRSTFVEERFDALRGLLNELAGELGYEHVDVLNYGGAVMNAIWALEHSPAVYFKLPRGSNSGGSLWDYGATACLFGELGAVASDIFGNSLELNRATSTFMNHNGLLYATHQNLADSVRQKLKNWL